MVDSWGLMKQWGQIIPPSRPSAEQLQYLASFAIKLDKTDAVAILGSTMEFRDILHELGFENIFIFDRNKEFYDQTSKERIYQNSESFIEGNWIDTIQKYKNKFTLILSDLTSGNIPYNFRSKFYSDIENALMEQGHFYDKVLTHSNFLSIATLIEKYESMPVNNFTVNYFNCEVVFCSEFLKETKIVDTTKIYQQLQKLSTNPRIQKFITLCKQITPEGFVWYYGELWEDLKSEYCKTLIPLNEFDDYKESPYFQRVKLFHLSKKGNERN